MRVIAVSGDARHPALPQGPTLRELWPEYVNSESWRSQDYPAMAITTAASSSAATTF